MSAPNNNIWGCSLVHISVERWQSITINPNPRYSSPSIHHLVTPSNTNIYWLIDSCMNSYSNDALQWRWRLYVWPIYFDPRWLFRDKLSTTTFGNSLTHCSLIRSYCSQSFKNITSRNERTWFELGNIWTIIADGHSTDKNKLINRVEEILTLPWDSIWFPLLIKVLDRCRWIAHHHPSLWINEEWRYIPLPSSSLV